MNALIAKYSQKGLLLDTNILLLYVIGNYDPNRIESFKRTNIFLQKDFTLYNVLSKRGIDAINFNPIRTAYW